MRQRDHCPPTRFGCRAALADARGAAPEDVARTLALYFPGSAAAVIPLAALANLLRADPDRIVVQGLFRGGASETSDVVLARVNVKNRGISTVYMICMRDNVRMQHLASKHQARLKVEDGEISGHVDPAWPTAASLMEEFIDSANGFVTAVLSWPLREAAPLGAVDDREIEIAADGELVGRLPARFSTLPSALNIG